MSKKMFWVRLLAYVVVGGLLPLTFIAFRFDLFEKVSTLSISGWTLISMLTVFIVFSFVFFMKLVKGVRDGLPFSYGTQLLNGLYKVIIPMLMAALILYYLKDSVDKVIQLFVVAIPCEMVAIAINPIRTWAHDNKLDEQGTNLRTVLESAGLIKKEGKK